MKKNLRFLCLGLAAATFATGFAQDNVTDKLLNADMEKGVLGWDITFNDQIWTKQTKTQAGYHGFNGSCLQVWKSGYDTGLTDNSVSQSLTGLPNGTYVFGAYLAAAKNDSVAVENRDIIEGVSLFANNVVAPVATNWPERTNYKWGHTAKFNVAATVTDGTLNVGIKAEATNANFIIWDNATLYYFGETSAEDALNEMAKIDLAASVALADTCKGHVYNVDSVAQLSAAVEAAKAVTGAAGAYEADENLWWAFRQARASINDYRNLNSAIAHAEEMLAVEWSDQQVEDNVTALQELVDASKAMYTAATAARPELNDQKTALYEASALVALDSMYVNMETRQAEVDEMEPSDEVGGYNQDMIDELEDLVYQVNVALDEVNAGNITAVRGHEVCDSLFALVDDIFANPISFDEFPILLERDANTDLGGYTFLKGTYRDDSDVNTYESRVFRFQYPLSKVRFVVKGTGSNGTYDDQHPFFTLSSFELFDEGGNEIYLSESDLNSNADHNQLNPNAIDGQGILGLVDDDPATYFHSTWGVQIPEYHFIEVTLPEGEYSAFSFKMRARGSSQNHQFPATVEIVYVSDAVANLQAAIASAKAYNPIQGALPGFVKEDVSSFYETVAAAEALLESEASEADILAAIDDLEDAQGKVEELKTIMPEAGKEYRIISGSSAFLAQQGVSKALSVYNDTTYNNRLYWETASADSAQQVFIFEPMANDEGRDYYTVKHKATGKYISDYFDYDGELGNNAHGLSETPDTVELISLGYGQFALANGANDGNESNWIHCGGHSSGAGKKDFTVKWRTEASNCSAWFIREMQTLPFNAKNISDLNFETVPYSLYEGVNSLTLTADKECAFTDLVIYDIYGEEIPSAVNVSGAVATVVLDTTLIESFSFAFTNTESVATVAVNGAITKLSVLQDAYEAALAAEPVRGDEIGQIKDLSEYDAAIAAAENLLANGGTDEAIQKAADDLDSAVVHLPSLINVPEADKEYFLISGLPAFKTTHGVDMALYAKADAPAWTYVNITAPTYRWKFVETDRMDGDRVFYLQNVGTQMYMGCSDAFSTALTMESSTASTQPFRIDAWGQNDQGHTELTLCDGRYSNGNLHFNGHNAGANAMGNVVYWSSTAGSASSIRIVESEKYIDEYLQEVGIEDVEIADEYVAPAKKGTYDLFGRRIEAPAATGIYVVDGKKRVVKK